MASNVLNKAPRELPWQMTHYIRKTVNFNDANIATGVKIGTLPKNAQILRLVSSIKVVFNAGTTNVLTVGTNAASYNNIAGAGDINEAATATQEILTGGQVDTSGGELDVFAMFAQTGTAATTGQAVLVLEYAPNNDQ